jgi:hypothetical protein
MKFNEFLNEKTKDKWIRKTVINTISDIMELNNSINNEQSCNIQNELISKQNGLAAILNGMAIGVAMEDHILLQKLRSLK